MPRIYSSTNRIRFTDIPEKYAVPRQFRAKQSEVHSAVVTYVFENYRDTKKYRQQVVDVLNKLTYCIIENEPPSFEWVATDPIDTMPDMDMDLIESVLKEIYLVPEAIEWDVVPSNKISYESEELAVNVSSNSNTVPLVKNNNSADIEAISTNNINSSESITRLTQPVNKILNRPLHQIREQQKLDTRNPLTPTPKEDLYIQPPRCPRFDVTKVWMSATVGGDDLVIYTTLPEIPTKQNEISVTTDMNMMTDSELMSLYPNHVIHTRPQQMYERYDGVDYDEDLGCIIPIEGFTRDQIVDNIIKYPHLYRLRKVSEDGSLTPFFSTIEINGQLVVTGDVWDSLLESKIIPRDPEFVKEYVVRRYLLERDNGVTHKYNMFGVLDPFLTLFMPCTKYIEKGYKDTLSIVKQCVTSRIHYKQSRSPILRRIENA